MILSKDSDVAFSGMRPNVRWHDTDQFKIPVAAIGTEPGHAVFQLLGRHGPRDPPVTQRCRASERGWGHAADQELRATGLCRLRKAGNVGKRRIPARKGVGALVAPEGPE